ncbi:MAG: hypothetical protein ACK4K9_09450 [Bacteroidia bacterium]
MNKLDDKPVLLSKRKNIQTLIDYCLDQRLSFGVSPRAISNDEFEVEIDVTNFKQAIALGMFAKENKFDVAGMGELVKPKTVQAKKTETKDVSNALLGEIGSDKDKKEEASLSFGLGIANN